MLTFDVGVFDCSSCLLDAVGFQGYSRQLGSRRHPGHLIARLNVQTELH